MIIKKKDLYIGDLESKLKKQELNFKLEKEQIIQKFEQQKSLTAT